MSRQLELDINRPSWADSDYKTEVKDLWRVRGNKAAEKTSVQTGSLNGKTGVHVAEYPKTEIAKDS